MVVVVVSMLTPPPREDQLVGLTYASITGEARKEVRASMGGFEYALTALVLGLVVCMYLYFSFWLS
jgi:hypothetical protein